MSFWLRPAQPADLDSVKALCDQHRLELGFVMRPALATAIAAAEVITAWGDEGLVGLVHFHHRRDSQTTLYHLAVASPWRGAGVGRALVLALRADAHAHGKAAIRLKCPTTLAANAFYQHVGFTLVAVDPGKRRPLNIWEMAIGPHLG